MDTNVQIWGVSPMRQNLSHVLQWRVSSSRMALLKCMVDEFAGDHRKILQLAIFSQQIIQSEETNKVNNLVMNYNTVLSEVRKDSLLGVEFVNNALTSVGYESILLELSGIVQSTITTAASKMYGQSSSPNSPVISNK